MSRFRFLCPLVAFSFTVAMPVGLTVSLAADVSPLPAENLTAYEAVGHTVATDLHLPSLAWTDAQFEAFITGLRAGLRGQPLQLDRETRAQFEAIGNRIADAQAQAQGKRSATATDSLAAYLEQARKQFQLQQAASGLLFRVASFGSGPRPTAGDVIVASFKATSPHASGNIPQLTKDKVRVKVADLMPGLAEGVQMLALDGTGVFLLPPGLCFGHGAWPDGITPGPLLFSVELHDIEPADAAP